MKAAMKTLGGVLYALVIVGAMSLGARQAFAERAEASCLNDGWNFLGACSSQLDCQNKCDQVHQPPVWGRCSTSGCCSCLF
jgi:hypothetical protein